jgi:hypothetical protein
MHWWILFWSGQVRSSGRAHNAVLYLTSRTGFTTCVILKGLYCEHTIFYVSIWLLTINKDYFPIQHSPTGFSNENTLCSVWGMKSILCRLWHGWSGKLLLLIQFQASPCEMCPQNGSTRRGFSQNMSGFPCQYHSTNAPFSYSSNTLLLPEGE